MATKQVFKAYIGFWHDHTHNLISGLTLTLPVRHSNFLLATLTLAVTISSTCFWIIAAFILHQRLVRRHGRYVDAVDLQHQVILRNSTSPLASLWDLIKVHLAWRYGSARRTWRRAFPLILFTFCLWSIFSIASIFVSEVASKSYDDIRTLLNSDFCGSMEFNTSTPAGRAYQNFIMKQSTKDARTYAINWYSNSSSSLTASTVFPMETLPIDISETQDCPFDISL
jgi:hypothetical protein